MVTDAHEKEDMSNRVSMGLGMVEPDKARGSCVRTFLGRALAVGQAGCEVGMHRIFDSLALELAQATGMALVVWEQWGF